MLANWYFLLDPRIIINLLFCKLSVMHNTNELIPDYMSALSVWQIHVTLTINMKKNYSRILGIICHSLRKLNQSEHMLKYPFINFWHPKDKYFLILSYLCNINYDFEKYSSIILATICQRFRHFKPFLCILKYPFVNCWDPICNYFFSLTDSCNINYKHEKNYSKLPTLTFKSYLWYPNI